MACPRRVGRGRTVETVRIATGVSLLLTGCALYQGESDEAPMCADPVLTTRRVVDMDPIGDSTAADADGVDLDGDGSIDNQLGNITVAIVQYTAFDPQVTHDRYVRRLGDDVSFTLQIAHCPEGDVASLPDGVPVGLMFDYSDSGAGGSVAAGEVTVVEGDDNDAVIAAALHSPYEEIAAEAFLPFAQTIPDYQDPSRILFDDDQDGTVTLDELRADSLWMTLLRPDLDLDGDGTSEGISNGLHVHFE
jgi:hypothetical protein